MTDTGMPNGWRDRFESLVGSRRDLWVVVAVVGAVMAAVLFLRFRSPPPLIAPPATETQIASTAEPTSPGTTPAPAQTELFVHVAGAVRKPGLYGLPEGARVADAIEAAGGETNKADLGAINLAEVLVDGAKVEVPRRTGGSGQTTVTPAPTTPATGTTTPAPYVIDLNTADTIALETIPGIGPVLATAIVQHRDENGPFPSVDALLEVSGIGPATLESVRPYVRV